MTSGGSKVVATNVCPSGGFVVSNTQQVACSNDIFDAIRFKCENGVLTAEAVYGDACPIETDAVVCAKEGTIRLEI